MAVLKGYIKATLDNQAKVDIINGLMFALHNIKPKENWRNANQNFDYGNSNNELHYSLLKVSPTRAEEIIIEFAFYIRGYDNNNPFSLLYNTLYYKTGADHYGNCLMSFTCLLYTSPSPRD